MSLTLHIEFEKAVRLLVECMPPSNEDSRKPILFHDIRVGVYLYDNKYSYDVVLAGLLHDAIEWSSVTEQIIRKEFGDTVALLVLASTKDDSILDEKEKTNELIARCINNGEDAIIVKTADIIDSFKWYSSQNNKEELGYCMRNADAILRLKPNYFNDVIFDELRVWKNKFDYLNEI